MLAAVSQHDLSTIFLVLALLAFALSIFVGYAGNVAAAVVLAFVGLVILLVA